MGKMFLDHTDHSQFLFDRVHEKPSHVLIASFGIYAGITYAGQDVTKWGEQYRTATRDLMEIMRGLPDVRMLIGVADYKSCKGKSTRCTDCEVEYVRAFMRLVNHAELFPEFKWRISTELHLKCSLFFYDKPARAAGVAGGRNFTDSSWADVTFELSIPDVRNYTHILPIFGINQNQLMIKRLNGCSRPKKSQRQR